MRTLRAWRTFSAEETMAAGAEIALAVRVPSLVLLEGELGAGKTTLMKGVAEALGAANADAVQSPTFTLMHEYDGERGGSPVRLYHLDLYRLEHERELPPLGLDETLAAADALVFVEWGEKFASLAQRADAIVRLREEDGTRSITMEVR